MNRIFSQDGPLTFILNTIADLVILNILTILFCIPVVTAGASLTAMYYVLIKMVRHEESYVAKMFFRSFRQNLFQATVIWICVMLGTAGLFCMNRAFSEDASMHTMQILIGVVSILFLCGIVYIFPVLSKFDNSIRATVRNAYLMSMLHLPKTILIFAIVVTFAAMYVILFLNVIPIMVLAGLTLPGYLTAYLFSGIFKRYEQTVGQNV
ncbi:MAG: DUF624 domain-containing protein [Lachnospiraceae bacterium]|nr:DUF624 domain-containing protein [Lachnospiraceae bacterium]